MVELSDWIEFFPHGKKPRPQQIKCINDTINFFEQDLFKQQITLLNAPTGVGKTLIGYVIAKYFNKKYRFGSNYLVHNKTLERQIIDDHLPDLSHTFGRSNFDCKTNNKTCEVGECIVSHDEKFKCEYKPMKISLSDKLNYIKSQSSDNESKDMTTMAKSLEDMDTYELKNLSNVMKDITATSVYNLKNQFTDKELMLYYQNYQGLYLSRSDICNYYNSKVQSLESAVALHNYYYYINEMRYIGDFQPRYLLICDEGHKIEDIILSFVSFGISKKVLNDLGFTTELKRYSLNSWFTIIHELLEYLKSEQFKNHINQVNIVSNQHGKGFHTDLKNNRLIQTKERLVEEIQRFEQLDKSNWVVNYIEDKDTKEIVKVELKPIEPKNYIYDILLKFSVKILIMSATLLSRDKTIQVLGIEDFDDDTRIQYIDLDCPFEVKNRLVYYHPISSMSYNTLKESTDKIVLEIQKILDQHKNEKGIIHTKSYQLMNMIATRMKDPRILIHDNDTRQDAINKYTQSEKPLVLVSPSLEEGMDFRDDTCRFIIIAKVPYLNLGDPQIKAHMNKDSAWYSWKAIQTIIQECGRGVRHEKDWCMMYILDSNFGSLLNGHKEYFPKWFLEAIRFDNGSNPLDDKDDL